MGIDRFVSFLSKSINNDYIDEVIIKNNIKKIISNHIIFDLNFLIYYSIIEIENEINDIIKIILSLQFNLNNYNILEQLLFFILKQEHWNKYFDDIIKILNQSDENIIISNFIDIVTNSININIENINNITLLDIIIYHKITLNIINYVNNLNHLPFIKNITLFCDGIPSFAKIIEQRKRRIKNYLETIEKKKLLNKYLNNINPYMINLLDNLSKKYIDINNEILFDYSKWLKNKFSIDKTISPSSSFINNLEIFINIKLSYYLPNIIITINSSKINGESDLKIFKFIASNNDYQDYSIHTSDSDLIHLMLIQQTYYNVINRDIKLCIIKYIKNNNNFNTVKILDGNLIIKNILDLYNNINNIKTNNHKIIFDLCLIFYFFGNDYLPSSVEIGPELGLEFFLKIHYISLNKKNIINIKFDKIDFDLNNLLIYFENINKFNKNNITKIILNRFFKINNKIINILVNNFELSFNEILDFFKKFIIYKSLILDKTEFNNLNEYDLRKIYNNNIDNNDIDKYINLSIFNLSNNNIEIFKDSILLFEENIDYFEYEYNGLVLYNKLINITSDPYYNIINYINDNVTLTLSKKYFFLYDYINIQEHLIYIDDLHYNEFDYLKKIYHLVTTLFGNMVNYHSDNLTYYKYNSIPPLIKLIEFLKNNKDLDKTFNIDINNDDIYNNYFNKINHFIIISPFLNNQLNNLNDSIKKIDNLEIDINGNNINEYKNIDIYNYLKNWYN